MIRIATTAAIIAAVLSLAACEANTGATASRAALSGKHGTAEPRFVAAEQARSSHHELLPHWPHGVVSIILTAEHR